MTMGTAPAADVGGKEGADDALIAQYFSRYDIDESGTLNTRAEFYQITLNLLFKLTHRKPETLKPDHVQDCITVLLGELGWEDFSDEHAYALPEYRRWFKQAY